MEYNAQVCNHKYISPRAVCTYGYTLVHYTPYSPAWGVLTVTGL